MWRAACPSHGGKNLGKTNEVYNLEIKNKNIYFYFHRFSKKLNLKNKIIKSNEVYNLDRGFNSLSYKT
jgi:hypothetical protein